MESRGAVQAELLGPEGDKRPGQPGFDPESIREFLLQQRRAYLLQVEAIEKLLELKPRKA